MKSRMVEGNGKPEMEVLNICGNQGNRDPACHGTTPRGSSVTNPDGDGLKFSNKCVISVFISKAILIIVLITALIIQSVKHCQEAPGPSDVSSCSQDWVKEGETIYYFSKVEADWNISQSNCSDCGGSLVTIENEQEMEFLKKNKGGEYWLGLWREEVHQPWKRLNGSVFNSWYPIKGEGLCAYLNDHVVSSTWCTNNRYWICKKLLHGS